MSDENINLPDASKMLSAYYEHHVGCYWVKDMGFLARLKLLAL
jgi:hypothetical protein